MYILWVHILAVIFHRRVSTPYSIEITSRFYPTVGFLDPYFKYLYLVRIPPIYIMDPQCVYDPRRIKHPI